LLFWSDLTKEVKIENPNGHEYSDLDLDPEEDTWIICNNVCSHIHIILNLNQMVPKTFSSLKILLEISEHIHVIGTKHLLQTFVGIKTLIVSQPHFEASVRMRLTLPKSGKLESSETPATLEFDNRGQKTSPWGVLYTVGKVLKCRCRKWPRMSRLDICSTSYGQKKGRESNWQFNSRPQKVRNRPDPSVCRCSATHCWKALEESYKFALDLIPIRVLSRELWVPKVSGVQTGIVSGLLLGSPGNKSHLDAGAVEQCREYYMGEGGGFPRVWAVVSQVSPTSPVACPNTKRVQNEF
jgi:hypothetical protein